jgi:serine/threonine protein kinase/TolB-like protein
MKTIRSQIKKSLRNLAAVAPRTLQTVKSQVRSRRQKKHVVMIGSLISHYKILENLGSGGLGTIYKAKDTKLKRTVALKFLPPELSGDEETKKIVIQEAQSASGLEHNNICNIHDIGETEKGQLFISMSCYEGKTLEQKIEGERLIQIDEILGIALQITGGLQKAHQQGITHRDIKPANIFITDDAVVKIFNFGLAHLAGQSKFTINGTSVGTVAYMSPEQAGGEEVDEHMDIWSLGVVLYEMLTGRLPFEGEDDKAVILSILNKDQEPITTVRSDVPVEFERIVNKALTKDLDGRYQQLADLNLDLKSLKNNLEKQKRIPDSNQTSREERKLAAIMFSDMVGYSAIAQKNESLAIELLEEHRRILRSIFPKHEGHEVETAGDSFFVEFSSALEAVNCAIEIQKTLFSHNKPVSEEKQINIRIGIHLADVVHKGSNVIGDGVNIAARIEPLAQSGGICISQDVVRQIQNKIDYPLKRFETANLKNIKQSIDIYTVDLPWLDKKFKPKSSKKHSKLVIWSVTLISVALIIIGGYYINNLMTPIDKPEAKSMPVIQWENSIAILPFKDLSPERDQEWFCDGMTEQLITNLAKLPRLKVISRTSVMKYKGADKTIPEIGKELNVAYVLEGSVRKFGDRIRVTAQLIGTKDDFHLWTEDYDREYKELFNMQDDISESIAANLLANFSPQDITEIKATRPGNTEAYEYLQKGNYYHGKLFINFDVNDWKTSELMYKKAIMFDPKFADSYASLADLYNSYYMKQAKTDAEKNRYMSLQEAYIDTAYKLNSTSANVLIAKGWVHRAKTREYYRLGDNDKVERELNEAFNSYKRAKEINGNLFWLKESLADFYLLRGLINLAVRYNSQAIEINPLNSGSYVWRGVANFRLKEYEKAEIDFNKALEIEPNHIDALFNLTQLLIALKRYDEAEKLLIQRKKIYPNQTIDWEHALIYASKGQKEKALETYDDKSILLYSLLGMKDEAMSMVPQWSENRLRQKSSRYYFLKNHPFYNNIRSGPRFQEILAEHKKIYEENLTNYGDIDL